MKNTGLWSQQFNILSDDSTSDSDIEVDDKPIIKPETPTTAIDQPVKEETAEGAILRKAEMYQEYMKHIPIPTVRGSIIPCNSWMGLGSSIKQLYGQPLHYLTNIRLKEWDQLRMGTEDEYKPLDSIIHPRKAEANIWLTEEVHRCTSSSHQIAKLWLSDPMYNAYIDPVFPQIPTSF